MAAALAPILLPAAIEHGPSILKYIGNIAKKIPIIGNIARFFGAGFEGMQIQSVTFNPDHGWTPRSAKNWLNQHGIEPIKRVHITKLKRTMRYRIQNPNKFELIRTKKIPSQGINLVMGLPVSKGKGRLINIPKRATMTKRKIEYKHPTLQRVKVTGFQPSKKVRIFVKYKHRNDPSKSLYYPEDFHQMRYGDILI
jgi:hypothetical protein